MSDYFPPFDDEGAMRLIRILVWTPERVFTGKVSAKFSQDKLFQYWCATNLNGYDEACGLAFPQYVLGKFGLDPLAHSMFEQPWATYHTIQNMMECYYLANREANQSPNAAFRNMMQKMRDINVSMSCKK